MNKFMKKIMSKKDGFTLVELIVVIAILAILAGVAVPAYSGYITKARDAAIITELDAIATAAQAANATAGEISKITVSPVSNGSQTITVEATKQATNYDKDFVLYYADAAATVEAGTDVWGTFRMSAITNFDTSSYKNGATWKDGEWTAD